MKNKEKIANTKNIIDSCDKILEYLSGYEYSDFVNDSKTFDAIITQLMHLGETTKIYRDNFGGIDCEMIGMRNFIAHNYLGISKKIIYNVAGKEIPKIKKILES